MRLSRSRITLLVVLGVAIAAAVLFATYHRKHVYFCESHSTGRSRASIVSVRDAARNDVLLDEPTNSLFVVLDGRPWVIDHGGPGVRLGMDVRHKKSFASLENDLLIGAAGFEIHEFKLPEGVAKNVFLAVSEEHCADVRPLLLEIYRGPDREALRQLLGLDEHGAQTRPAATAPNEP